VTPRRVLRALGRAASGLLLVITLTATSQASENSEAATDAELRTRIEAQLAALPDREGAEIRVAVTDGQVVLQGRVHLLEQSLRAEQTVWKTPGVLDVDNELRVIPHGVGGDAAIERQVRTIIKGDGRFVDTNLEVEVMAGIVRLRGLFQDPADVLALKHRIASIAGVLDVEIDALLVARRGAKGAHHAS